MNLICITNLKATKLKSIFLNFTKNSFMNSEIIKVSYSLGSMLAVTISWSLNKSLFWAIFHGICGWLYVIYYAIGNPNNDDINQ